MKESKTMTPKLFEERNASIGYHCITCEICDEMWLQITDEEGNVLATVEDIQVIFRDMEIVKNTKVVKQIFKLWKFVKGENK